jgi:hypothetical protein
MRRRLTETNYQSGTKSDSPKNSPQRCLETARAID